MQAPAVVAPAVVADRPEKRDWIAWFDDLSREEAREMRARLLDASYEDVKAEPELKHFFFLHSEDVAAELPPGAERIAELHGILAAMRGNDDPDIAEKRRKAIGFLLAEYQRHLRDNPWDF